MNIAELEHILGREFRDKDEDKEQEIRQRLEELLDDARELSEPSRNDLSETLWQQIHRIVWCNCDEEKDEGDESEREDIRFAASVELRAMIALAQMIHRPPPPKTRR